MQEKNFKRISSVMRPMRLLVCFCGTMISFVNGQTILDDSSHVTLDTVLIIEENPTVRLGSHSYSREEIQKGSGVFADPIRVLQSSPNVVAVSDFQAIPIIAGDDAEGILTLLDGFPLAFPYRLLGGFSLFNPLSIKGIDVLDAGYPVYYGGYASTAISIRSDPQYSSRTNIQADFSLPISSLFFQFPISDTLQFSSKFAVRSSHVGLISRLLRGEGRKRIESFLPDMKDAQFFFSQIPSAHVFLFQEGLYSDEKGNLNAVDRIFNYSWKKGFAGASIIYTTDKHSFENRISWVQDWLSLSTVIPLSTVGPRQFDIACKFSSVRLFSRYDRNIYPTLKLSVGGEINYGISDVQLQTFSGWLNSKSPIQSDLLNTSGFVELSWSLTESIHGTFGMRGTYFGLLHRYGVEPRAHLNYIFPNKIRLDLSAGQYLQAPSDFQMLHGFLSFLSMPNQTPRMMLVSENKDLIQPEIHNLFSGRISGDMITTSSSSLAFEISGYLKRTEALILPARYPYVFTPLDTMSFEPLQCFHSIKTGVGVSLILNLFNLHSSIVGSIFTYRSRVVDERNAKEYKAVGDIPVSAKLSFQFDASAWSFNLMYHYAVGAPMTEQFFVETTSIMGNIIPIPVWRELNTSRLPSYHRLDFQIDWKFHDARWKMTALVNIVNLLWSRNVSGYQFIYEEQAQDLVRKEPVYNTLPFLPIIGIRCEYTL